MPSERSQETTRNIGIFARRLGDVIRAYRQARGLSQRQLAARTKRSRSGAYISQIERGKRVLNLATLFDIAVALGITIDQLLGDVIRSGIAGSETRMLLRHYDALAKEDRTVAREIMQSLARGAWRKRVAKSHST